MNAWKARYGILSTHWLTAFELQFHCDWPYALTQPTRNRNHQECNCEMVQKNSRALFLPPAKCNRLVVFPQSMMRSQNYV